MTNFQHLVNNVVPAGVKKQLQTAPEDEGRAYSSTLIFFT